MSSSFDSADFDPPARPYRPAPMLGREVDVSSQWNNEERRQYDLPDEGEPVQVRRRLWLPIVLFLLTMASTFIAGATGWCGMALMLAKAPWNR